MTGPTSWSSMRKEWEFEEIVPDDVIEDEAEEDLQNEEELSEEIRGEGDEE